MLRRLRRADCLTPLPDYPVARYALRRLLMTKRSPTYVAVDTLPGYSLVPSHKFFATAQAVRLFAGIEQPATRDLALALASVMVHLSRQLAEALAVSALNAVIEFLAHVMTGFHVRQRLNSQA